MRRLALTSLFPPPSFLFPLFDIPHANQVYSSFVGPVAQLGARLNRTEEVKGSTPFRSMSGPIAQLGARLNGIEKVEGSTPSGSTLEGAHDRAPLTTSTGNEREQ